MSRALALLLLCSCAGPALRPPAGHLARAALDGHLETVRELLNQGADPDDRLGEMDPPLNHLSYERWTALQAAAGRGRPDVVRLLIAAGADLTKDDGYGATALDMAFSAPSNVEEIALLLIKAGAPVDTRVGVYIDDYGDGHTTALHRAAGAGLVRVVKAMIDRGVYVHPRTTAGWTPLFYAGNAEIARMLRRAGAGMEAKDRNGMTPLAYAVVRDQDGIAIALLKEGADPNIRWDRHRTPIHEALLPERKPLIEALLDAGADPNQEDDGHQTPLQRVSSRLSSEYEELALLLLAKGARPNLGETRWDIPLHGAALAGHRRLAAALLQKGAELNRKDEDGDTALHVACEDEKEEIVKLLFSRGADLTLKNKEGKTPVDAATKQSIRNILLGNR